MGFQTVLAVLLALSCSAGFILFRKNAVPIVRRPFSAAGKLSVIIPARNEEKSLPFLLESLRRQSLPPHEIIVVDDASEDRTKEIAESCGVETIENPPLPPGWTGKNWAVWNGYARSSGDLIAFLDADVRLAPHALESLLAARERTGGVISVVPFHHTEKLYERLALIPNILGIFAFTSPFEKNNPQKGLYGSCIFAKRADYDRAKGHEGVKSELLDDLSLGANFAKAGIPVTNFIGRGLVSFRMYPGGIRSEVEGFGKGAALSAGKLSLKTVLLTAFWLAGLLAAEAAPFFLHTPAGLPLAAGYLLFTLQMIYFVNYTGRFGKWMPLLHPLSTAFFLFVMLYSLYRVLFVGRVAWKGRDIDLGG
ncbi:glycosyltransferase [Cohnella massiliensis]|uniref:glycosyltransferase n=1 Tax=Cohnella massiliensis TaxID=1816691 RepID=UPI0009B9AD85|nr:glycosyltransferase [Cohnella massiliensis]